MKATEKIKLMMRLEKGFKKLDLEELHMIRDTLNKEIKFKFKLFWSKKKLCIKQDYLKLSETIRKVLVVIGV